MSGASGWRGIGGRGARIESELWQKNQVKVR